MSTKCQQNVNRYLSGKYLSCSIHRTDCVKKMSNRLQSLLILFEKSSTIKVEKHCISMLLGIYEARRQHGFESRPFSQPFIWRHSSAGRASASHAEGHRFEFCCLHQNKKAVAKAAAFLFFVLLPMGAPPFDTIKARGGQSRPCAILLASFRIRGAHAPPVRRPVYIYSAGDPLQQVRSQI